MIRFALLAACLCLLWHNLTASAMFMNLNEPVPVDRLVANLGRFVQEHPEDADGHYTLGRVHSLAYAKLAYGEGGGDANTVELIPAEKRPEGGGPATQPHRELPAFAPYESVRVGRMREAPPKLSKPAREHLEASLRHYGKAVELAPDNALYRLGHAWMLEQAGLYAQTAQEPANRGLGDFPATQPSWREQALAGYRKAFEVAFPQDKARRHYLSTPDALVSREAAEGVIRHLEGQESAEARQEVEKMREAIAELREIPMAITPIVLTMEPGRSWGSLVDPGRRTRFELAGDGLERDWPWLRGDVGLLVWDPKRTGRIESGRQLFGSSTWWMFWDTGYEALAALDDDGDGRLAGPELAGIRVWFDRDGDGRSGRGEVVSLATLGIVALRTGAESHSAADVAAWNPHGIELRDGGTLPTWDWRPTSLEPATDDEPAPPILAAAGV